MAVPKPTLYRGERTEEIWKAETAFILAESLVATPRTLRKRRRFIERKGGHAYPLHLMPDAQRIVWDADDDAKPGEWFPVGAPDSMRPLAWLPRRAWSEWHWFRGISPGANREHIPLVVAAAVVARDWPTCQICGGEVALNEQHLDHIQPYSLGGPNTVENLRLAHDLCNIRRGVGK